MITAAVALFAVLLLAFTLQDSFEVMLLPRRVVRQVRFVGLFYRATWAAWSLLAAGLLRNSRREQFLSIYGALSMVLLFRYLDNGSDPRLWLNVLGSADRGRRRHGRRSAPSSI
jgi:hypothetical protein